MIECYLGLVKYFWLPAYTVWPRPFLTHNPPELIIVGSRPKFKTFFYVP